MSAILRWFGTYLLGSVLSELFKKAAIFLAFNIILQFALAYITGHGVGGINPLNVGSSLTSLLSSITNPMVLYVMDLFYVVQGLFLVLNAYLARFAYRLTLSALKG
jgi:hypothetical protein